mmetsp:Transcript_29367/g.62361  ORF Transcript_29367/g.62361 Transcript_29367/m.62361 type:complete len:269 (+) Transcript_29367:384-1190(+)
MYITRGNIFQSLVLRRTYPLRQPSSRIGMGEHGYPRFVGIIGILRYEICAPQSECTANISLALQHHPRPILVLASLVHQHLRPVPEPPVAAVRHEVPGLDDEYLRTLTPRDLGVRTDLLDLRVLHHQFVVHRYRALVGEEGTDAVEGGVDGRVAFEAGVGLNLLRVRGGADGVDVLFVTRVGYPLQVNLGPPVPVELLLHELVARDLLPSVPRLGQCCPVLLLEEDVARPSLNVPSDLLEVFPLFAWTFLLRRFWRYFWFGFRLRLRF